MRDPAVRALCADLCAPLRLEHGLGHSRVDDAGRDHTDRDVVGGELLGEGLAERVQPGLCGAVGRAVGLAAERST